MTSRDTFKILIAEDDADDRYLIEDAFAECGLVQQIEFVVDGVELMDYLNRKGEYEELDTKPLPNLILLDLNMPRKNGLTALQEIKSSPELCRIPVSALTTSKAQEDIIKTSGSGVNSFITKPVTFENSVEVINTLTHYWEDIVTLASDKVA